MKITITAETEAEKKSFGDKEAIVHEGVNKVVIAGQKPDGSLTFAHGNHFDISSELHRVKLQLDTQFETNVVIEREVRKLEVLGQMQQAAVIASQVNGRGNLKLRN